MSSGQPEEPPSLDHVVSVLNDEGCREIVSTLESPMTAQEIADSAGLPVSTTYRKLDRLTDAGLVRQTVSVRHERHQEARYVLDFEEITIDFDDANALRVAIGHRLTTTIQDLSAIWPNEKHEA